MPKTSVSEALGRALVAAAWTDGSLDAEERRALEDLLFGLPDLSIEAWRLLEQDMASPVSDADRRRRFAALHDAIADEPDRELCRNVMALLVGRASPLGESDQEALEGLLEELAQAPEEKGEGILGKLGGWLKAPLQARARALASHEQSESRFTRDVRLQILEKVRERLGWNPGAVDIDDDQLNLLCLMGAILARVADADHDVNDDEFDGIRQALTEHLDVDMLSASIVTEIATGEISEALDTYALVREYFHRTTEEERLRFLDAMFAVAAADDHVSTVEMEEIRLITQGMLLSHRQFIDAKVKVPKRIRDS